MFNPFGKRLNEITPDDLNALRTVSEGWYVEYKRAVGDVAQIAKSISSFANTYGGWVFYGVAESDDGTNRAGAFPGISKLDLSLIETRIREAMRTYLSPAPFYETKIFAGPAPVLGLDEDKAVLAVYVPMGTTAPYIHGSGRIYRRVADSSDPKAETDRHFLDLLWKRSDRIQHEFSEFVRLAPELSKGEKDYTVLRLMLFPDPWRQRGLGSRLSFAEFCEIMRPANQGAWCISLENVFTSSEGYVARQAKNNDPYGQLLTWTYRFDCSSEIVLPLSSVKYSNVGQALEFLHGYATQLDFVRLCRESGLNSGVLIDLSQLAALLFAILDKADRLLCAEGLNWPLHMKARISGAWRRTPFLDLPSALEFLKENGVIVVQKDICYAPEGFEPDSCCRLPEPAEDIENPKLKPFIPTVAAFSSICMALGLPVEVLLEKDEQLFSSLFGDTFGRATQVGVTRANKTRR